MGWTVLWYSSFGSDFNSDFQVTIDEAAAPAEHDDLRKAELDAKEESPVTQVEAPGVSIFLRLGAEVFHAYSAYGRGVEPLAGTYRHLDLTPFGRRDEWEDSPGGWPKSPSEGWIRHHDRYGEDTGL